VARFLESRGMIEDALEVATDPDYRFELAIQLGRLEAAKVRSIDSTFGWTPQLVMEAFFSFSCFNLVFLIFVISFGWNDNFVSALNVFLLQEIASEVQSESKWKQLGELAMSSGKVSRYLNRHLIARNNYGLHCSKLIHNILSILGTLYDEMDNRMKNYSPT